MKCFKFFFIFIFVVLVLFCCMLFCFVMFYYIYFDVLQNNFMVNNFLLFCFDFQKDLYFIAFCFFFDDYMFVMFDIFIEFGKVVFVEVVDIIYYNFEYGFFNLI